LAAHPRVVVIEQVQETGNLDPDPLVPFFLVTGPRHGALTSGAREERRHHGPFVESVHGGVCEEGHGRHGCRIHRPLVQGVVEQLVQGFVGVFRFARVQGPDQVRDVVAVPARVMQRRPVDPVEFLGWSHAGEL